MPKVLESCLVMFGISLDRDLGQHRIVGLPVCIATELQHSAAAALQGHRAVSAGAACCKAAAQQG